MDTNESRFHVCSNCSVNMCANMICRDCHMKMCQKREGKCVDCEKTFMALRHDGTKKQRCFSCQEAYNLKYINVCPKCGSNYHSTSKDGRSFGMCFKCYQQSFVICARCNRKSTLKHPLCKKCYEETKEDLEDKTKVQKDCKTKECDEKTYYTYCNKCHKEFSIVHIHGIT